MKHIWIMNHYASDMFFNKGGRHYWFAKYLKREGYDPVVFCCNARHNSECEHYNELNGKLWCDRIAEEIQVPFVFVQGRDYKGNGKQRILNMIDFYRNVKKAAKEYAKLHGKPDIVLASSVHPLTMVAGLQLADYFHVKCICEVRDLWPESLVAYNVAGPENPAVILLRQMEKWIYKKADALIFTHEGALEYIRDRGWDKEHAGPVDLSKVHHINNGVDLEAFRANLEMYPFSDKDLTDSDTYKVVYAGAIRRVNNLELVLEAAKLIEDPSIRILVFGDGDELETLKSRVQKENISNIVFKGSVKKQFIPSIESQADLNLAHWQMNPILRFGESANKVFEYFAAGKPVFYTVRPKYSIVEKFGCGMLTEGFEPKDIADGIQKMAHMSNEEKAAMAFNAKKAAEVYDFKNLTKKLIEIIENV